jgi:hypothetical protein
MTDYRNPNDPFYRNAPDDPPEDKNNRWGVIVGVLFLVIVAGLALGVGHKPGQVASNDTNSPATLPSTPPGNPTMAPASPPSPTRQ